MMLYTIVQFLLSICFAEFVNGVALPDYIKPCSRNDPDLNECALNSARESINRYSQGDSSRNLKPLDPLFVPEMTVYVPNEQGLKLVFKDNNFTGLANLELLNLRFNLDKKVIIADALTNLSVKSLYELTGKILIVPVDSTGDALIKLKNTTLHLRMWYEHIEGADGKIHWNIIKHDVKYDVGKAIFRLENILNDKNIGDQVNKLLNELWRDIVADVGPIIAKAMCGAVMENLDSLLEQVSYDELMPPS